MPAGRWLLLGGGILAAAFLLWFLVLRPDGGGGGGNVDEALMGAWRYENSSGGTLMTVDTVYEESGSYAQKTVFHEEGAAQWLRQSDREPTSGPSDPETGYGDLTPDGGDLRSTHWSFEDGAARQVYFIMPYSLQIYLQYPNPVLADFAARGAQTDWVLAETNGRTETWTLDIAFGGQDWQMVFVTSPGRYTFNAEMEDRGTLTAAEGKYRAISDSLGILEGDYALSDPNTLALKDARASTVWKRVR
jgi:hypothetical protein